MVQKQNFCLKFETISAAIDMFGHDILNTYVKNTEIVQTDSLK